MKTNKTYNVAVTSVSPFVMEKDGDYSGFDVELWEMIAKEAGWQFEYSKHHFQELIPLAASKKVDVAFAAVTIKEEREKLVDFSYPTFHSGLRILLSKNRGNIDVAGSMRSFLFQGYKQLIKPALVLLLIILVFGHVLWFAEKSSDAFASMYFPGVFQATWMSLSLILGADWNAVYSTSTWLGRVILMAAQITNLAVLGLLIGEITSFITTRKIRLNIEGPKDLRGKVVATVRGTTSETILKSLGATVVTVVNIEKAYDKLKRNQVEAVVFDAPVLVYYALNDGADWCEVVGELFDEQEYGILLAPGSRLRKKINLSILAIRERGEYDRLYAKWFGVETS